MKNPVNFWKNLTGSFASLRTTGPSRSNKAFFEGYLNCNKHSAAELNDAFTVKVTSNGQNGIITYRTLTYCYQAQTSSDAKLGNTVKALKPENTATPAVILEFKVFDPRRGEKGLEDTAANALAQIEEKKYEASLLALGIPKERILKYGLVFRGRECLVRKG